MLIGLLLVGGLLVSAGASAVDIPRVSIQRASDDATIRVTIDAGIVSSGGYNIYRDGRYVTTVRPPRGAGAFTASVGSSGGSYCVVAFEESAGRTTYSRCSASVRIAASVDNPPTPPVDLRAVVYSRGVGEILWRPASDDGRVVGYRVERDGVVVLETRGRNLFEPRLDPGRRYNYSVVAIDDKGNESRAATVSMLPIVGNPSPPLPSSPSGSPPAPPSGLRGVAYSPGVVETFWNASPDEGRIAGYALSRDGAQIAFIRGRSVFQTGLVPSRRYRYELVAVGRDGARSAPLSLELSASPSSAPEPKREMYTVPERLMLVEGETPGLDVELKFERTAGDTRPLALSVRDADGGTPDDLQVRLEPAVLGATQSVARLRISLPLAIGPRMPGQRTLQVRIDDGESVVDKPIVIDIEPTSAPDVYLLLGQSNMEGYSERGAKQSAPGQPDAPNERLFQLHVKASNPRFYASEADYTRAEANLAEPLFIPAEDPLHDRLWPGQPGKSGDFIGASLSFGKAALADTTSDIYLVPAAWGATGFCANANGARAWNAAPSTDPVFGGTLLVERALWRLDVALRESGGILRGIFWHQGGADSNDALCAAAYADNLVAMVRRLRRDARPDARGASARGPEAAVPFIVATQSKGVDSRGDFSRFSANKAQVDRAHRSIADLVPYADVVINDDLVPPAYPCGQSSCVHFGAAALREQGERFHRALQRVRAR